MTARHYPPAARRYQEKRPTISVRLTKGLKEDLDAYRGDVSYSEALRKLLHEKEEKIRDAAELERLRDEDYEAGYNEGYEEGRRVERVILPCARCGRPVEYSSESPETWQRVKFDIQGAFTSLHAECE